MNYSKKFLLILGFLHCFFAVFPQHHRLIQTSDIVLASAISYDKQNIAIATKDSVFVIKTDDFAIQSKMRIEIPNDFSIRKISFGNNNVNQI